MRQHLHQLGAEDINPLNRTAFLVDGFNLYHSVRDAARQVPGGKGTKWLDLKRLCLSYLHVIGNSAQLADVFYFSALAKHLEATNPDVTKRHQTFIACLQASGVHVELARFKRKNIPCNHCGKNVIRREEKETDVAIAVKMMELMHLRSCETIVLMTGDTDIAPAARAACRLFPSCSIWFAFPYGRKNKELEQLTGKSFQMTKDSYLRHQFSDPYVLPDKLDRRCGSQRARTSAQLRFGGDAWSAIGVRLAERVMGQRGCKQAYCEWGKHFFPVSRRRTGPACCPAHQNLRNAAYQRKHALRRKG